MVATPATAQGNVASDGARLRDAVASIERAFVGKREAIEFALIAMLARGHVLFEDVPGVGGSGGGDCRRRILPLVVIVGGPY